MLVNISDDLIRLQSMGLLEDMLLDRTTKRNIMWGTDAYAERGPSFDQNEEITPSLITGENVGLIKTRARKAFEQQNARTRKRGEVFTPLWIVKRMCDDADAEWFKRKDGFWKTDKNGHIRFTKSRTWKQYVENRRMELTCGEAPYLTTRYDAENGEIIPVSERVGLLDRKLRAVNENAEGPDEWMEWTYKALRSVYGYEFQGDSLLIARVNLLMAFSENMETVWGRKPMLDQYKKAIRVITWNVWQMNGLTDRVPYRTAEEQVSFFADDEKGRMLWCRIYNWRQRRSVQFLSLKGEKTRMKFDFIIGNPPYQDETLGENKGFAPPIYDKFMEEAYKVADKVELIHPARFLFNAGSTPKAWNQKMLADPHLKVLYYEQDGSKVFSNTEIKGGVAITYHDNTAVFGALRIFTPYQELNAILQKAAPTDDAHSLSSIMYNQMRFNLDTLYAKHPEYRAVIGSNGRDKRFRNNIFEKVPLFTEEMHLASDVRVIGVIKNKRQWRYFPLEFIDSSHENIFAWKVLVARVNGSGVLGDVLSTPIICAPNEGYTQTFIGIGSFASSEDANSALKYIKTKFLRLLLGTLKITQDNSIETWRMIPLQDFTPASDIDWSKSIPEIDQQLYRKYGLDQTEIDFIESNVKEMT